jgi:HD superfamily phosphohydrolase YqeK
MRRNLEVYVAAVCALAIAGFVALYQSESAADPRFWYAATAFAFLGFVSYAFDYTRTRDLSGSSAFLPFLATAALAPGWTSVIVVALTALVKEALARRAPLKGAFNVAQTALAVSCAILVYRGLGGAALLDDEQFRLIPYLGLFGAYLTVNSLAVSAAISLSQSRPTREVWREVFLRTVGYDFLSLPFVYGFALVYTNWGALGVLALALPLLGVRQLYKTNAQLEKVNQELLELMVAAIEARDPYTSGHSRRVSRYARIIARSHGLGGNSTERIGIAALLHDVGKIHEVYAPLLRKADKLSSSERAVMETHPIKSAELVENVTSLRDIVPAVRHHHENWDGSGYPSGLAGEAIPLAARIIMVADTIDAMTTDRPYRSAMSEEDVRRELTRMSGRQFDPGLCESLLHGSSLAALLASTADRRPPLRRMTPEQSRRQVGTA